jgi:hypothetical protein
MQKTHKQHTQYYHKTTTKEKTVKLINTTTQHQNKQPTKKPKPTNKQTKLHNQPTKQKKIADKNPNKKITLTPQ